MISSNETSSPPKPERRWPKHLLMAVVVTAILGTIATNLTARPSRSKRLLEKATHDGGDRASIERLNAEFASHLDRQQLDACGEADWLTVCRRLNLGLAGCGLSLEDIRSLERVPEEERIDYWLEFLLRDPRTFDYLAERFTRAFVGTNNGPFLLFRRRKFKLWLADELEKGVPYDRIVRQLISAEGLWTDRPAVNFITATMDEDDKGRADPIRLAGRTSRAFLGMRVDCLQCHDDFLGNVKLGSQEQPVEGTQKDFHRLAAFFSGAGIPNKNAFVGIRDDKSNYSVKLLGEEEETELEASVPFLPGLLPEEGSKRNRLAQWVTHSENKAFARATVNRTWALLFGRPLVTPVDDIPIQGPYPPGLELLAEDFVAHRFDWRHLVRTIVALDVFRRDSRSDRFAITEAHEEHWAAFPLTQLRPEQVAGSIHQSCRLKTVDEESAIISKLEMFGYVNDFTKGFGDRGDDEFVPQAVTIPQRLLMMNGGLVHERTKNNPVLNASSRIGALASDDGKAVEVAFLSTLNRMPTEEERRELAKHLAGKRGDSRGHAMSDIFWMLINSSEFLWNH